MSLLKLTAANLVSAINSLRKDVLYDYIDTSNNNKIQIVSIDGPEGPIKIRRRRNGKNSDLSISKKALWRLADALSTGEPVNVDRVFSGSYNFRSALEALLVHTPDFYWCKLQRIQPGISGKEIVSGHKHIVWMPDDPHKNGIAEEYKSDIVISETISNSIVYDSLPLNKSLDLDINVKRRHVQIQIALSAIGFQLGFRTWIARNDQGITYGNEKIANLNGIINDIESEKIISSFDKAVDAALHIDCIWFKNGKLMPAVMEVEHSTGVTSGLTRMNKLRILLPPYSNTRWVIVASDEDRDKVFREAKNPMFCDLDARFFPYSAVEELYSLCIRRKLTNNAINESFLDCFMEKCVN